MTNPVKNLAILSGILLIVAFVLLMRLMATHSAVTAASAHGLHSEQAQNVKHEVDQWHRVR